VETKLMEGLHNYLPAGLTYEQFDKKYKIGSTTVLPTISDDLKKGAIKATIFSIMIICLYIFIRFRDWRYSLGTIVALLHDVLLTLAVFSFLRNVVNFPAGTRPAFYCRRTNGDRFLDERYGDCVRQDP
jgi:SecD/SecF fusion protein